VEQPYVVQSQLVLGWSLLLTNLPSAEIVDVILPETIERLATLVARENTEIQLATGEALALLIEVFKDEGHVLKELSSYVDLDLLMITLSELTKENSKHRTRKDRTQIRSEFKVILDSIELGYSPKESATFQHQKVDFEGWTEIRQLQFFRCYLQVGFYEHFLNNPVVQQVFDIQLNANYVASSLSSIQKRMTKSSNSVEAKARTRFLANKRKNRNAARNGEVDE